MLVERRFGRIPANQIGVIALLLLCGLALLPHLTRLTMLPGRRVLLSCLDESKPSPAGTDLFLQAVVLQCRGDDATMAWQAYIGNSAERMGVVQAFRPNDIALAAYAAGVQPNDAIAQFWLGDSATAAGDNELAMQAYARGLELNPTDGLIWRKLGDLYHSADNVSAALHAYNEACVRWDRGKNGCMRAAGLYFQAAHYEQAIARYKDSLKQLPDYAPARLGLAQSLLASGHISEAIPILQTLAVEGNQAAQNALQEFSIEKP
ncbi:MAG: tetratricopeptide repeat protein [Anaerolineae bacterium]|nr:tetratricopeptide repeat protein [Anaerolineae bacterium]MCO5207416.1 tetratricopeptide repeat protein [Anaerolineae bacterium]